MTKTVLSYWLINEDQINFAYHNWFYDTDVPMSECLYHLDEQGTITKITRYGYEVKRQMGDIREGT